MTSKYLEVYEHVVFQYGDVSNLAGLNMPQRLKVKREAVRAAAAASPEEAELLDWYNIQRGVAMRGGKWDISTWPREKYDRACQLAGSVANIWRRALGKPGGRKAKSTDMLKGIAAAQQVGGLSQRDRISAWLESAFPHESPATQAYRRMARKMDELPSDNVLALALGVDLQCIADARNALLKEDYYFDDQPNGCWRVAGRPSDRAAARTRILQRIDRMSDDELKTFALMVDEMVIA